MKGLGIGEGGILELVCDFATSADPPFITGKADFTQSFKAVEPH